MRFNRVFNNKYLYNDFIYANNINNLQQTTYANCKQPIYISDDMIDHKDGEVTSDQTKEFLRLYSTGKPNIDMVESIDTLSKRYNLNESISYSSVFETYKNNILFKFAVIDESGVELDPFEKETNGIMGTIYIHTQKEDDYIEFWWDFDENIIGIGGTDDLMLDYNLNSGDVDLLSCKYSEEFVNTLLDAVDEFVNN